MDGELSWVCSCSNRRSWRGHRPGTAAECDGRPRRQPARIAEAGASAQGISANPRQPTRKPSRQPSGLGTFSFCDRSRRQLKDKPANWATGFGPCSELGGLGILRPLSFEIGARRRAKLTGAVVVSCPGNQDGDGQVSPRCCHFRPGIKPGIELSTGRQGMPQDLRRAIFPMPAVLPPANIRSGARAVPQPTQAARPGREPRLPRGPERTAELRGEVRPGLFGVACGSRRPRRFWDEKLSLPRSRSPC